MTTVRKSYFICGIGGSGMAPIASILKGQGHHVSGSDRAFDRGETPEKFKKLKQQGFDIFPQDGSGITETIDYVVASAAVEHKIPDVARAREKNIPILGKADILADLLNHGKTLAIAGTSGKTTVTGMAGFILKECGADPAMMNGGHIVNFLDEGMKAGNAMTGQGCFVAETDESDGSIEKYSPFVTVLNNISFDHKPLEELRPMFEGLLKRTRQTAVINIDDKEAAAFKALHDHTITFSSKDEQADYFADEIHEYPDSVSCSVHDKRSGKIFNLTLQMPGRHNVMNALAALAGCGVLGIDLEDAVQALCRLKGIKRRFEVIGTANDITIIDDFGHNPDKIAATLRALKAFDGRVIVIFQPHGFGPTKMLKDDLIHTFTDRLGDDDILIMPDIYYAGGTADKTISSDDIIQALKNKGKQAFYLKDRPSIRDFLQGHASAGDRIVIMGARDDTLPDFARDILNDLKRIAA